MHHQLKGDMMYSVQVLSKQSGRSSCRDGMWMYKRGAVDVWESSQDGLFPRTVHSLAVNRYQSRYIGLLQYPSDNHSRYHISKLLKNAAWNERLENGGTAQEIRAVIQKIKHQSLARARLTTLNIVSSVYETLRPSIKGGPETHAV